MLFKIIFNLSFVLLLGMSMYYTFLYTQISEDISEMKYKLKNCYYSIVNEEQETSETFKPKKNIKKIKLSKRK